MMTLFTTSAHRVTQCLSLSLRILTIMVSHAITCFLVYPDNYQCERIDSAQDCYAQRSPLSIYPYTFSLIRIDGRSERGSDHSENSVDPDADINRDYYSDGSLCLWNSHSSECLLRDPTDSFAHILTVLIVALIISIPIHSFCEWALTTCTGTNFFLSLFYIDESIYEGMYQEKVKKKVAERDSMVLQEYYASMEEEVYVPPDTRTMVEKQLDLLYSDTVPSPNNVVYRKKPTKHKGGHAYYDSAKVAVAPRLDQEPSTVADDKQVKETGGYEKLKRRQKLHDTLKNFDGNLITFVKTAESRSNDKFIHKFSFDGYPANIATARAEVEYLYTVSRAIVNPSFKKYSSREEISLSHSPDFVRQNSIGEDGIRSEYLRHMLFLNKNGRFKQFDSYTLLRGYRSCRDYLHHQIERSRLKSEQIVRHMDILSLSQHSSAVKAPDVLCDDVQVDINRVVQDVYLCEQFLLHTLPKEVQPFAQFVLFDEPINRILNRMERQAVRDSRGSSGRSRSKLSSQKSRYSMSEFGQDRFRSRSSSFNHFSLALRYSECSAGAIRFYHDYREVLIAILLVFYVLLSTTFLMFFGLFLGSVSILAWVMLVSISIFMDVVIYIPIFVGITHVLIYDVMVHHMRIMHQLLMDRYHHNLSESNHEETMNLSPVNNTKADSSSHSRDIAENNGGSAISLMQHFNPACRAARICAVKSGMFEGDTADHEGLSRPSQFRTYNNDIRKAMQLHDCSSDEMPVQDPSVLEKNIPMLLCNISEFDLHRGDISPNSLLQRISFSIHKVLLTSLKTFFMLCPGWLHMTVLQWITVLPVIVALFLALYYLFLYQHSLLLPISAVVVLVLVIVLWELRTGYDKHAVDVARIREATYTLMADIVHRPKDHPADIKQDGTDYDYNSSDIAYEPSEEYKHRRLLANESFGIVHDILFSPLSGGMSEKSVGSPKSVRSPSSPARRSSPVGTEKSATVGQKSGKSSSMIYPQPLSHSHAVEELLKEEPSYIAPRNDFANPERSGRSNKAPKTIGDEELTGKSMYSPERTERNTNVNAGKIDKYLIPSVLERPTMPEPDDTHSVTGSLARHKLPPIHVTAEKDMKHGRSKAFLPNESYVSVFTSGSTKKNLKNTDSVTHPYSSYHSSGHITNDQLDASASKPSGKSTKSKSKKMQMTIEEYHLLSKTIATVFVEEENAVAEDDESIQPAVVSQSFLIASSLNRALGEDTVEDISPEEYAEKSRILEKVLRRMIHKDGSVIIVSASSKAPGSRLLQLNPSSVIRKSLLK